MVFVDTLVIHIRNGKEYVRMVAPMPQGRKCFYQCDSCSALGAERAWLSQRSCDSRAFGWIAKNMFVLTVYRASTRRMVCLINATSGLFRDETLLMVNYRGIFIASYKEKTKGSLVKADHIINP